LCEFFSFYFEEGTAKYWNQNIFNPFWDQIAFESHFSTR